MDPALLSLLGGPLTDCKPCAAGLNRLVCQRIIVLKQVFLGKWLCQFIRVLCGWQGAECGCASSCNCVFVGGVYMTIEGVCMPGKVACKS